MTTPLSPKDLPPVKPAPESTAWTLRSHILVRFVAVATVAYFLQIGLVALLTLNTADKVVEDGRDGLTEQVRDTAEALIESAALYLESVFEAGLTGLMFPTIVFATDYKHRLPLCGTCEHPLVYSPLESFADTFTPVGSYPPVINPQDLDPRFGLTPIDTEHSSVFFTDQLNDGVTSKWVKNANAIAINATSYLDYWAPTYWKGDNVFASVYWGEEIEGGDKVWRVYPGQKSNLENDNYNPVSRPWYRPAQTLAESMVNTYDPFRSPSDIVHHTEPYKDFQRNTWMITLSRAVYAPTSVCSLRGWVDCPEAMVLSRRVGVIGVDMQISELRDVITNLRTRDTGRTHVFVTASGQVVLSPTWEADASDNTAVYMNTIVSSSALTRMQNTDSGSFVSDGKLHVFHSFASNRYTIVMVTPMNEVLEAMDSEEDTIRSDATSLFGISVAICLVMLAVVIGIILFTSRQIALPLNHIADDARAVSKNIGGSDLFDGVNLDDNATGCDEVMNVRGPFVYMMHQMKLIRQTFGQTMWRTNPFFGRDELAGASPASVTPNVEHLIENVNKESCPELENLQAPERPPVAENRFGSMRAWINLRVVVPIILGMLIVLIITAVQTDKASSDWVAPMRTELLQEEKRNIGTRAETIAKWAESLFSNLATSVNQLADFAEESLSDNLEKEGTRTELFFSPTSFSNEWTLTPPGGLTTDPRTSSLRSNLQTNAYYKNRQSGYANEAGFQAPFSDPKWNNEWLPQALKLMEIDEATRAVWMGNPLMLSTYMSSESAEEMWLYPYQDLSSLVAWQGNCVATNFFRTGYTPVCRPWYQGAKSLPEGEIFFDSLSVDAFTGKLLLSISRSIYVGGSFWGVASADFSVFALQSELDQMKIYSTGYTFLMDANSDAAIHPRLSENSIKTPLIDLEFPAGQCDRSVFQSQVLPRMEARESGNIELDKCGSDWFFSWQPINGTTYVLGVMVPLSNVVAASERLVEDVNDTVSSSIGLTVGLMVLVVLASVYLAHRLSKTLSKPLTDLTKYLDDLHRSRYAHDIPPMEHVCHELFVIHNSVKDLVVALRFGNPAYASSSGSEKERQNLYAALEIVRRNEFTHGIGACMGNIGDTTRRMQKNGAYVRENPEMWLLAALENGKEEMKHENSPSASDAVAQRLFNLAQYYMDYYERTGRPELQDMARQAFEEAARTPVSTPLIPAQFAYVLSIREQMNEKRAREEQKVSADDVWLARKQGNGGLKQSSSSWAPPAYQAVVNPTAPPMDGDIAIAPPPYEQVKVFNDEIISLLASHSLTIMGEMGEVNPKAMCLALYALHETDPTVIEWMLFRLRNLPVFIMCRAAQILRHRHRPQFVDGLMSEVDGVQWNGDGPFEVDRTESFKLDLLPKAIVFTLDTSGSMAGMRLQTCKSSLQMIVRDHSDANGMLGLVTFSGDVTVRVQLNHVKQLQTDGLHATGRTAFYDAMNTSLDMLSAVDSSKYVPWLVALTDGDDNSSKADPAAVLRRIKRLDVNLALITVGELSAETMGAVRAFVQAAKGDTTISEHIAATDVASIAAAFQHVGKMMQDTAATVGEFL